MQIHDFSHYQFPDDPEAPVTSEIDRQLEEISECWLGIISDEIERSPLSRAYFGTIMMLCEGQMMQ